jgi:acetyl esterase/lipase
MCRNRSSIFYSAALIVSVCLLITPAAPNQGSAGVDPAKVAVVYRVPKMEQAVVRAGVVFANPPTGALALDAYIPRGLRRGERRPAIVFVSGAESVRHWRWFISWGQIAAAHGFVGVVPDKRYPPSVDGIRTGYADTETLLTFLRTNGDRFGIDPRRICLWTFSAGGRLTSVGLKAGGPPVQCLVSFYGVLDLSAGLAGVTGEAEREALLRQLSPLHALDAQVASGGKVPPIFIARAGKDIAPINAGIDRFTAAALRLNAPLTVVNYADGDHGFDGINDTAQSRAIIEAALRFVREQTGAN